MHGVFRIFEQAKVNTATFIARSDIQLIIRDQLVPQKTTCWVSFYHCASASTSSKMSSIQTASSLYDAIFPLRLLLVPLGLQPCVLRVQKSSMPHRWLLWIHFLFSLVSWIILVVCNYDSRYWNKLRSTIAIKSSNLMQGICLCEPVLAIVVGFLTSAKLPHLFNLLYHFDDQVDLTTLVRYPFVIVSFVTAPFYNRFDVEPPKTPTIYRRLHGCSRYRWCNLYAHLQRLPGHFARNGNHAMFNDIVQPAARRCHVCQFCCDRSAGVDSIPAIELCTKVTKHLETMKMDQMFTSRTKIDSHRFSFPNFLHSQTDS